MATFFKNKTNTDQNLAELFGINTESNSGETVDTRPAELQQNDLYLSPEAVREILLASYKDLHG
jgi:hypothetical protein